MIQHMHFRIQINNLARKQVTAMRTTINIDDKIWNQFELEIIRRFGNCRSRKKALKKAQILLGIFVCDSF
jgi:hypothetical protein